MLTHKNHLIDAMTRDLVARDGVEDRVIRGLMRFFDPEGENYVAHVSEWQTFLAQGEGHLSCPELFQQAKVATKWGPKYLLTGAPHVVRCVHQIAMLFWKEEVQKEPDWEAFADRIRHSGRPDIPHDLRVKLSTILAGWLGQAPDWSEVCPVMGTGATADRCDAESRWEIPSRPLDIPGEFYTFNLHDPRDIPGRIPISRAAAVPKNRKSCRYVASEPVGALCAQLGLKQFIDFRCYDVFHTRVPLYDAERHARLMINSKDHVTIDLSNASDLLSVEAMYQILPSDWFALFMSCRSQGVELPNGEIVPAAVMATMGNGFCFRLLSLVTAAVCELFPHRYSVYGDDLIVHRDVAPSVCWVLERLGLVVNRDKTCYGRYRETCGHELCDDLDVTPFKPRTLLEFRGQPADIEQAYNALGRGLPTVSAYLISGLDSCPTRSNRRYQYIERRIPMRVPRGRCSVHIDGWPGISRWAILNARRQGPPLCDNTEVLKYTRMTIGFRWVRDSDKISDVVDEMTRIAMREISEPIDLPTA